MLSCSRKTVFEKVREEYAKGNYREAVFIARHHFRQGGERTPELLFLTARSFIQLGREAEADDAFAEIYSIDSTWAPRIAGVLKQEAVGSLEKGQDSKGKRYIIRAVNYDPRMDFGKYNLIAGEILLERRAFPDAAVFFERYLAENPDTAGAASAMVNLGETYEKMGEPIKAMETYRLFQEKYPKSRMASTARWKLENLMLNAGEELFVGGEREEAENLLAELAETADNPLVSEKANFILGQIFESKQETEKAIYYYSKVVHMNLGSSGRLVERAKERIEYLETSKTRR